jgi:hypothetical protein
MRRYEEMRRHEPFAGRMPGGGILFAASSYSR